MKIVVAIKQVPDTSTQVRIGADSREIDPAGITWIISPYDEFALEEAVRIKEGLGQGTVVAVSVGPERARDALRSCFAMGADDAILVRDDDAAKGGDTLPIARALAAVIGREGPAIAFFGRQAIDDDMGAVPAQVAELLGWPLAGWVMKVTVTGEGRSVRVDRQIEGGLEVLEIPLPCLLSAQKGLNEPRYPTLKGVMAAKRKEIRELRAADLGLAADELTLNLVGLDTVPARPPGRIIGGEPAQAVRELVRVLREDAKVI